MKRTTFFLAVSFCWTASLAQDASHAVLTRAYEALNAKNYATALASFEEAIRLAPDNPVPRKDAAYVYLKVGEAVKARDQFAAAMKLDPKDESAALEFAYLAFETGQRRQARLVFQAWADRSPSAAATFGRLDQDLAAGIARWKEIVQQSANNWSAHNDLARLAEERDENSLAAEHFRYAWQLRQDMRELLVDFGRVAARTGDPQTQRTGFAALLAASRGSDSYTAERAQAMLPSRYPFLYEFEDAIAIDSKNRTLRREHAYLLLAMGRRADAMTAFREMLELFPDDELSRAQLGLLELRHGNSDRGLTLLRRVMEGPDPGLRQRVMPVVLPELARRDRELGVKSLQAGYLQDAVRFLTAAYENNPRDHEVMLKLGWAHNLLKQDDHAIEWFRLAKKSSNENVAQEAKKAYRNLGGAGWRTTVWLFPMYSSRWESAFGYGQMKTEWRTKSPLRPYFSVRFAGDSRGDIGTVTQAFLSESSLLFAGGVSTKYWHGLVGWAETGIAVNYLPGRRDIPRSMADHRAGLSFTKAMGNALDGESTGWFADTTDDAVFVSRFQNNTLLVSQNRGGWTLGRVQPFWALNLTTDARRQAWANFTETGPGVRVRLNSAAHATVSWLQGNFLREPVPPFGDKYRDLRIGVWYAFTR